MQTEIPLQILEKIGCAVSIIVLDVFHPNSPIQQVSPLLLFFL